MKYRKRVTLFPGVRLNISRSGISTTIGVPGASINLGRRGTYFNAGIPGTGLYDRRRIGGGSVLGGRRQRVVEVEPSGPVSPPASAAPAADLTSAALHDLALEVHTCRVERAGIVAALGRAERRLKGARRWRLVLRGLLVGWIIPVLSRRVGRVEEEVHALRARHAGTTVDVELDMPDALSDAYARLRRAFLQLAGSERIWDITNEVAMDGVTSRSGVSRSLTRVPVAFDMGEVPELRCPHGGMHLRNANGADILLFPAFAALLDADGGLGFVDLAEVALSSREVRFVERDPVPGDAEVVGCTWEKVNKDGSPDRRFRDNRQLPVLLYGELRITSNTGLREAYQVSDHRRAVHFAEAFAAYARALRHLDAGV